MMILDGTLPATLACLAAITDPALRLKTFTGAIVERGGSIILPPDTDHGADHWGPHQVEFSFLGILGTGATPSEALAEWTTCATRLVEAERAVCSAVGPADDLHDACLLVRTRSRDPVAIRLAVATGKDFVVLETVEFVGRTADPTLPLL